MFTGEPVIAPRVLVGTMPWDGNEVPASERRFTPTLVRTIIPGLNAPLPVDVDVAMDVAVGPPPPGPSGSMTITS